MKKKKRQIDPLAGQPGRAHSPINYYNTSLRNSKKL